MRNKGQTPVQQQFSGPGASELLKTTRERAGQDLQTVAQVLRIRHVYLEAIEGGRFDELPGKTYVVGFVRAYAEYLGLDSEEVVKRFKDEIAGLEGKAELVFPLTCDRTKRSRWRDYFDRYDYYRRSLWGMVFLIFTRSFHGGIGAGPSGQVC